MKHTLLTITFLITLSFTSQAVSYDKANWYVSVDVSQVRSKIIPLLPQAKSARIQFSINKHLPPEVQQISLYGHSEVEDDLSLVINGDFATFELNNYINNLMYLVPAEEDITVALFDTHKYQGSLIEQYKVADDDESKAFYSAKINSDLIVVSLEQEEIKNWIDQKYNSHELKNSGLVSVLVNIESAMAHMGADLSSNRQSFNSAMFQKITQFSASVFESSEHLAIDAALSTADEATAKQLEQVLNGLIAMNALSNLDQDKPLMSALMSNLSISNQGNALLVSSQFALSLIPEINLD
ncbi:hypothetical protein [Marinicella litoralis]|uniref:Uncharacterized protein n=1 Tax=Marinicella litoralis TaxID=644220 RepID=A0A4R6XV46_9GAMM|nr:hypothetical protein [Marinicella litoralis]TDR23885.1 hypothetical protein C8D91_0752 [Marinicella litoralis]